MRHVATASILGYLGNSDNIELDKTGEADEQAIFTRGIFARGIDDDY